MQSMINNSISNALLPLQQQLHRMSSVNNDPLQFQALRQQQKLLAIDSQSAAMLSPGGKSQFRYLAKIQLFVNNALEALNNLENGQGDVTSVREHIQSAASLASERLDLVIRADADPKFGWKALSLYEEQQRQSNSVRNNSDPEFNKSWANCLKKAQELPKKNPPKVDRPPFRPKPGSQSGRDTMPGCIALSKKILINALSTDVIFKEKAKKKKSLLTLIIQEIFLFSFLSLKNMRI